MQFKEEWEGGRRHGGAFLKQKINLHLISVCCSHLALKTSVAFKNTPSCWTQCVLDLPTELIIYIYFLIGNLNAAPNLSAKPVCVRVRVCVCVWMDMQRNRKKVHSTPEVKKRKEISLKEARLFGGRDGAAIGQPGVTFAGDRLISWIVE